MNWDIQGKTLNCLIVKYNRVGFNSTETVWFFFILLIKFSSWICSIILDEWNCLHVFILRYEMTLFYDILIIHWRWMFLLYVINTRTQSFETVILFLVIFLFSKIFLMMLFITCCITSLKLLFLLMSASLFFWVKVSVTFQSLIHYKVSQDFTRLKLKHWQILFCFSLLHFFFI